MKRDGLAIRFAPEERAMSWKTLQMLDNVVEASGLLSRTQKLAKLVFFNL